MQSYSWSEYGILKLILQHLKKKDLYTLTASKTLQETLAYQNNWYGKNKKADLENWGYENWSFSFLFSDIIFKTFQLTKGHP